MVDRRESQLGSDVIIFSVNFAFEERKMAKDGERWRWAAAASPDVTGIGGRRRRQRRHRRRRRRLHRFFNSFKFFLPKFSRTSLSGVVSSNFYVKGELK